MLKSCFHHSIWCTGLALLLIACGSTRRTTEKVADALSVAVPSPRAALSESDRQRLEYYYLEAAKQKLLDNHVAAYDLLQYCRTICPDAPEVLYDLSLYNMLLQDTTAWHMLERAAQLDPQNTYYLQSLASYQLEHNQPEAALAQLEKLARLEPSRTDVLGQLVSLYIRQNRPADAIRTLDRIEMLEGKLQNVSYQKFALYKQMGQEKKAFAELESLCREYPHEMSYRLAIGNQLLQADRIAEAQKVYDQVRRIEPDNAGLKLSMLELYRKTDNDSLFSLMRDSLMFAPSTESNVRGALLHDYVTEEMQEDSTGRHRVVATFDRLDSLFAKDLDILQLRAAYLATYDRQNDSDFVAIMNRIIDLEPENTQALFYLMQYYGQHQDYPRLEDICRRGVLTHPDELVCHYYLGIACYQQDKKTEAMHTFREGILRKTPESRTGMVADLYSIVGDLLHEMGDEKGCFEAYDSCLVYQDDNVSCLNNYAYFLSLKETDLDRAEEMSYRAIRLEPDNRTFLDTYAWILFMKGRYGEAQAYMDRVCPPEAEDSALLADPQVGGVVLEHAGDIAAMNGLQDQALRFWLLAEKAGGRGLTPLLPRKIKMKRYIK